MRMEMTEYTVEKPSKFLIEKKAQADSMYGFFFFS